MIQSVCETLTLPTRYFVIHNLAQDEAEVIRYAALLRGTESAWQAVSYGLESITIFAEVGGVYFNFALWAVSIFPAWQIIKHFGTSHPGNDSEAPESEASDAKPGRDALKEPLGESD